MAAFSELLLLSNSCTGSVYVAFRVQFYNLLLLGKRVSKNCAFKVPEVEYKAAGKRTHYHTQWLVPYYDVTSNTESGVTTSKCDQTNTRKEDVTTKSFAMLSFTSNT